MSKYHLGLNLGHDRAAALVKNGEIIVAIHQERLDRLKHSVGFLHQATHDPSQIQLPHEAIQYCLKSCGIHLADVATISANMPGSDQSEKILNRHLPTEFTGKILATPTHHRLHAYSAYWPSGFKDALVFVADASGISQDGQTESYSLFSAHDGTIKSLHKEWVPSHLAPLSTLGFLYEYISRKAGFITQVGSSIRVPEAGKLMGLAAYGGPQDQWRPWIGLTPDSYSVELSAYDIFLEVAALEKRYDDGRGTKYLRPYLVDLAWKVQHELEQSLLHIVGQAVKKTGLRRLCLAGGVSLNSVANYKLLRLLNLEDIFIFPAGGDAGIAAGCALWAYAEHEKGVNRRPMRKASLGHTYKEETISKALQRFSDRIEFEQLTDDQVVEQTAQALAKGYIVARFEGGSEFGPRALGNRSILADPTFKHMKDILNARIKYREPFRPFAPVIPEEKIAEVFQQKVPSPFMLVVAQIKREYHELIPAVTHHDGSGRVQTVTARDNPFFHRLCYQMAALRDGPPIILNTSFNVSGQPIVETPEESIETFLDTNIDYLFLENYRITKRNIPLLAYEQHLDKVRETILPKGLPPGQKGVTELMHQLDKALFFGNWESCPWTAEELRLLSREGAIFKETSRIFTDTPLGNQLQTQPSKDTTLLLDPINGSQLVDMQGRVPAAHLSWSDIGLLQALLTKNQPLLENLRLERQCTSQAWNKEVASLVEQLRPFDLDLTTAETEDIAKHPEDSTVTQTAALTLEPYINEDFHLFNTLASLRTVLNMADYQERAICTLLKVETLQEIKPTHLHYFDRFLIPDTPLADLIRLFLLHSRLPEIKLRNLFGDELFDVLTRLDILYPCAQQWASRIDLFCVEGLYIATDHRYMLGQENHLNETPVMYIGLDSRGLVHAAPRKPSTTLLDLCTGSGIQALSGSRYAKLAIGIDLNPRAIRFARFNAQLNGIQNVHFLQGNLYAPVEDMTFDIILANPPFVPSPHKDLSFRDGGETGEEVLERIINQADLFLTPEGQMHIVTDLVDIVDYSTKLANWWQGGPAHKLVLGTADRNEILFSVPHCHAPFNQSFEAYNTELDKWLCNFRNTEIKSVNFGYIFIKRIKDTEPDSYYCRIIHNPTIPIHHEVANYFIQRQKMAKLTMGNKSAFHVRLNPKVKFRVEFSLTDDAQQTELFVPGNPYYTTYMINDEIYLELQSIEKYQPSMAVFEDETQWKRIQDLILKGILDLTAAAPQPVRNIQHRGGMIPEPRSNPLHHRDDQGPEQEIQELETKTTPTCLSSYLS